ncbi:unnamed protein product, partial [Coregonus sp. 'balchen']
WQVSSVGARAVPNMPMAMTGAGGLQCRRNCKLDSFLKRNTERGVYERIRAYEPCVVVSERVNKVFMHVVLSDECVYLAEYPPRTLTTAVDFRHIRDIELVNDLPEFLSGRDRERSQHIRIGGTLLSTRSEPPDRDGWNVSPVPMSRNREEEEEEEEVLRLKTTRSASCPNPETLGQRQGLRLTQPRPLPNPISPALSLHSPRSPLSPVSPSLSPSPPCDRTQRPPEAPLVPRRRGSVLARLLKRERVVRERDGEKDEEEGGEREAELHLYAVSPTSRIYLHLQSSWNSYIIRSTLLLDPLYRRRCNVIYCFNILFHGHSFTPLSVCSWERTAHLFRQLSGELCTLIAQTLALMFRETEIEPARLNMLTTKQGALTARLLLALVCDPELQAQSQTQGSWSVSPDSRQGSPPHTEASRTPSLEHFLTVGWILRILLPHPSLLSFVGYQARQVVVVLSGSQAPLSPSQAALLFQRCRVLLACLKFSSHLGQHLRTEYREEFRYYVKLPCVEEKLPPDYPISQPALRLVSQLLGLIIQKS